MKNFSSNNEINRIRKTKIKKYIYKNNIKKHAKYVRSCERQTEN